MQVRKFFILKHKSVDCFFLNTKHKQFKLDTKDDLDKWVRLLNEKFQRLKQQRSKSPMK